MIMPFRLSYLSSKVADGAIPGFRIKVTDTSSKSLSDPDVPLLQKKFMRNSQQYCILFICAVMNYRKGNGRIVSASKHTTYCIYRKSFDFCRIILNFDVYRFNSNCSIMILLYFPSQLVYFFDCTTREKLSVGIQMAEVLHTEDRFERRCRFMYNILQSI
jgi:hypothetical protein